MLSDRDPLLLAPQGLREARLRLEGVVGRQKDMVEREKFIKGFVHRGRVYLCGTRRRTHLLPIERAAICHWHRAFSGAAEAASKTR
jgi:hypothetical protein